MVSETPCCLGHPSLRGRVGSRVWRRSNRSNALKVTMTAMVSKFCAACGREVLTPEDPVRAMAAFPAELSRLVESIPEAELERRPQSGEWSVKEVVAHLAETEVAFGWRLRTMIADDHPTLATYDQNAWTAALVHEGYSVPDALSLFRALRISHCGLLAALESTAWERTARHPERGEITVRALVDHRAHHDLQHFAKLEDKIGRLRRL